ncbi:hypothetical protein FE257_005235 [Aspergillus nanangensis]|uniref:Uncharacterized protein n=1 Tax=Aspergillus nanangensis TaxID=2582783 RepID=A0AAD4CRA6_ASPNN|nr:hypothetical protein FE257_005235 [Aspergillus nanangensis]
MSFVTGKVQYVPLPHAYLDGWLQTYIDFRLSALKKEPPGTFTACYDCESGASRERWKTILNDKAFHPIIDVYHTTINSDQQTLSNGRWIGLVHLQGPLAIDPHKLSPNRIVDQSQKQVEIYWLLSRAYLDRDFRGYRIAPEKIDFIFQYIREQVVRMFGSQGPVWVRCRILRTTVSPVPPDVEKSNARTGWRQLREVTHDEFLDLLMKEHAPLNQNSCSSCGGSSYKGKRMIYQKVMDVNVGSIAHL